MRALALLHSLSSVALFVCIIVDEKQGLFGLDSQALCANCAPVMGSSLEVPEMSRFTFSFVSITGLRRKLLTAQHAVSISPLLCYFFPSLALSSSLSLSLYSQAQSTRNPVLCFASVFLKYETSQDLLEAGIQQHST